MQPHAAAHPAASAPGLQANGPAAQPPSPQPPSRGPLSEAEVTASPLDYDAAVRCLRQTGVVLLPGALGAGVVAGAERAVRAAFDRLPEVAQRNEAGLESALKRLSMIAPGLSPDFSDLLHLARRLVEDGVVRPILERYFGGPIVPDTETLRFRSHRPAQTLSFVPLHQDVSFTRPDRSWINAWVPLTPCGRDAPGLQVYPLPQPAIFSHGGAAVEGGYPMGYIEDRALAGYPQPLGPVEPSFEPGDVLLFDGYCPHRTVERPGMSRMRISFEFRYTCELSRGPGKDALRQSIALR